MQSATLTSLDSVLSNLFPILEMSWTERNRDPRGHPWRSFYHTQHIYLSDGPTLRLLLLLAFDAEVHLGGGGGICSQAPKEGAPK